jgi:hypothetical protein
MKMLFNTALKAFHAALLLLFGAVSKALSLVTKKAAVHYDPKLLPRSNAVTFRFPRICQL